MDSTSWVTIESHLRQSLEPHLPRECLDEWASSLLASAAGRVLAASLVIDLRNKRLAPALLSEILRRAKPDGYDPLKTFSESVERDPSYPKGILCACGCDDQPAGLVRVLDLDSFFKFYVLPSVALPPLSKAQDWARRMLGSPGGWPLGFVTSAWQGRRPLVWVTRHQSISALGHSDASATELNDALGLGLEHSTWLLYVSYPEDTGDPMATFQPTALDPKWSKSQHWFISSATTGWGKTQSLSGLRSGLPERVHMFIPGLTDGFRGRLLGRTAAVASDQIALLAEALTRAKYAALDSRSAET